MKITVKYEKNIHNNICKKDKMLDDKTCKLNEFRSNHD